MTYRFWFSLFPIVSNANTKSVSYWFKNDLEYGKKNNNNHQHSFMNETHCFVYVKFNMLFLVVDTAGTDVIVEIEILNAWMFSSAMLRKRRYIQLHTWNITSHLTNSMQKRTRIENISKVWTNAVVWRQNIISERNVRHRINYVCYGGL